jgi:hypothetical protein
VIFEIALGIGPLHALGQARPEAAIFQLGRSNENR